MTRAALGLFCFFWACTAAIAFSGQVFDANGNLLGAYVSTDLIAVDVSPQLSIAVPANNSGFNVQIPQYFYTQASCAGTAFLAENDAILPQAVNVGAANSVTAYYPTPPYALQNIQSWSFNTHCNNQQIGNWIVGIPASIVLSGVPPFSTNRPACVRDLSFDWTQPCDAVSALLL